jgi:predicted ribosomally synthesized peptide with SipW-like signal peptide
MSKTEPNGPVIVRPSNKRRRLAALIAVGSLATAGIIGVTMASFTDSEFAGLNDSASQGGYGTSLWNLQISADGTSWSDTTNPNTPGQADNLAADTGVPINLTIDGAENLVPGDAASDVTTTFKVRNQDTSTQNAQITDFKLITDPANASDASLLSALRFTVTTDAGGSVTAQTYDQLAAGVALNAPVLAPGAVVTYTVTVDLPDQGGATQDAALQGLHVYLIADVDGDSSTAAATVD